jgi:biotin carboxylase
LSEGFSVDASAALGLPHNSLAAAEAARDKHLMRRLFALAGVPSPSFRLRSTGDNLVALAAETAYPCVVKPLRLNGSRGVIRADTPEEFVAFAPDEHFEAYSYGSELLSQDGAVASLVACAATQDTDPD